MTLIRSNFGVEYRVTRSGLKRNCLGLCFILFFQARWFSPPRLSGAGYVFPPILVHILWFVLDTPDHLQQRWAHSNSTDSKPSSTPIVQLIKSFPRLFQRTIQPISTYVIIQSHCIGFTNKLLVYCISKSLKTCCISARRCFCIKCISQMDYIQEHNVIED